MGILCEQTSWSFEIIYVDDGSHDRTLKLLQEFHRVESQVRVLVLSRNFGHQIAVTAGLEHASSDVVVIIDADLQDPPETIGQMLEQWHQGVDVVYGVRLERAGETVYKRWSAKLFYRLVNMLSGTAIPLDTGDFRLMDRQVVQAFLSMPERDRFVRGMVAWTGFRQKPIFYKRAARASGRTKYSLKKMLRLAVDGLLSFSRTPLRLSMWLGFMASGLALVGIAYATILRLLTQQWVAGWTLLFIGIMFLGGLQLLMLGLIGEYVGRIYNEVKGRPLYFIRERLGFAENPKSSDTAEVFTPLRQ